MAQKPLDGLNEQQRKAAETLRGPVLIIAGAGSGKTRALTHRLAHLIETGTSPQRIVALTFTNKAAEEMRSRVVALLGEKKAHLPFMGTFHALGGRILREEMHHIGRSHDFIIYDTKDQRALIKELMAVHEVPADRLSPAGVHAEISRQKNELVNPAAYRETASTLYEKTIAPLYEAYEAELRAANAVDFDDLLALPVRLLSAHADVRARYQERWHHILVDEYQDTNHAQYVLLRLLAAKHRNLCVVGDDWQSIYRFRGADFRNILHFERDWPDATTVLLEENYRSTRPILDAAQAVIEKNQFRTHKELRTKKVGKSKPRIVRVDDETSEGIWVLDEIERLKTAQDGLRSLSDAVVLYRTNAQSRVFEELLVERGVAYNIVGSVRFYERREVKDILAYLRLVVNPKDAVSLKRVANVPPRGIGEATLKKMLDRSFDNSEDRRIGALETLLASLRTDAETSSLQQLTTNILKKTKYKTYLKVGTREGEERWENVQELVSVTSSFGHLPARKTLSAFLEEVALLSPADEVSGEGNVLNLMTLHAVKGLEFDAVFIVGCEDGLLPHERSTENPEGLEEERRLMYVGMTRARSRLYMMFAARRTLFGSSALTLPSRFLGDIPDHLTNLTVSTGETLKIIEL